GGESRFEQGKLFHRAAPRAESERAAVERSPGRIALFDAVRSPLGQITTRDGKSWAYDPGGTPLGAARADGDRVVLTDRDGGAKGFVVGLPQESAAALLLGGGLGDLDRVVLAVALSR